jgi:hypothetical protein
MSLLTITFAVGILLCVLVLSHFLHYAGATTVPLHRSKQERIGVDHPIHHEVGLPDDLPEVSPPPPPTPGRVPFVSNQALIAAMHKPTPWHPAYYNTSHRFVPLTLIAEATSHGDSEDSTKEQQTASVL